MTFTRETATTDALLTDLYLDALLAGAVLDAAAAAAGAAAGGAAGDARARGPRLDPAARDAADRLRRDLVRVHPSFRFEERLATRLAEAAVAMRLPLAAGAEGRVVPFRPADPGPDPLTGPDSEDGRLDSSELAPATTSAATPGDAARRAAPRPLLIGGALTSAAISIAGAAWVAWRIGRPGRGGSPMARAARAVREGRLLDPGTIATTLEPGLRLRGAGRASRAARRSTRRRLD